MDADYIRERITRLRMKKGMSERELSLWMGHSGSYIQGITSGRTLPSMGEFLCMCDCFGISPKEFFDEELEDPAAIVELMKLLKKLPEKDLQLISNFVERLISDK